MENVAASETVGGFQILGRDDLHAFDQAGEIRRIVGKSSDDDRTEFPATEVPIPVPQFIRRKLHAGGEDVLAFGREFGIENRGDADVEIGRWRKFAVLGSVKGALEIIDFRTDVNAAGERFQKTLGWIKRGESGKATESEIDFGDSAIRTEILDAIGERRIELGRIEEMEEGALGIQAGGDRVDGDLFAAGEHDASNGAVLDANVLDFGIDANFRASLLCRFGKSPREAAEPAARKGSGAHGVRIASGTEKKNSRGTRGPGTEGRAENAAGGDDGANKLGFEEFGNEVRNGHGSPAKKIEDALLAQHAHVAAGLEQCPEVFGRGLVNRGRGNGNKLVENSGEMIESVGKFHVLGGIAFGNIRDAASGPGVIVPKKKRASVGLGSEDARSGIKDFARKFIELHVARDLRAKRAESVRESRGFEAGIEFFRDSAAANHFAAFEDEGLEAALGKIKSGDESVVPAADENYTLSEGHGQLAAFDAAAVEREGPDFARRASEASDHSFKMTWLASRPLAPMMPPPG